MEFGYKNTMEFIIQHRSRQGEVSHSLIEAGSEKDALRKMKNQSETAETKLVTNIKTNGKFGSIGYGQLPNVDKDLEQVYEDLKGEEE